MSSFKEYWHNIGEGDGLGILPDYDKMLCTWEASEKATLERIRKRILELKRDPIADYDDLTINTIVDMIGLEEIR